MKNVFRKIRSFRDNTGGSVIRYMDFTKMQRGAFIPLYENPVKISIIPETVLERDPADRQIAVDQIPDDILHFVFHDQLLGRHSKIFF